jgi:hypothetical protein
VPWLRRLANSLLRHRPQFDPSPNPLPYLVSRVAMGQFIWECIGFPVSASIHKCSILNHLSLRLYCISNLQHRYKRNNQTSNVFWCTDRETNTAKKAMQCTTMQQLMYASHGSMSQELTQVNGCFSWSWTAVKVSLFLAWTKFKLLYLQ